MDVHCHHSQDWRNIVHSLLGIRASGHTEITGEACEDDQSCHFRFKHLWHYLLDHLSLLWNVACSERIGMWLLRKPGNMHSQRFIGHVFRLVGFSLQHYTCTYISHPSPLWMEWREAQKVPYFLYFHPYYVGLVMATSLIPYSAYNYIGGWDCFVSVSPLIYDAKDSDVEGICGSNAKNQHLFISGIPLFLVSIFIIIWMILLYQTVLIQ